MPGHRKPCDLPSAQSSASFWHREPSTLLKAHRSTRNLPKTADVVVIGSGITGASAAHHILHSNRGDKEKLDVVMLEAREACWGATGRNGGHCQPILFEHPHDPSIGRFELRNFDELQRLIKEQDIECEFVAQPGVRAICSQDHLEQTSKALMTLVKEAPDLADKTRFVTFKHNLASFRIPTALGAVLTTVAARMWPYKFVARILEDLITATSLPGGTFNLQTLTPVTSISSSKDHHEVSTPRGTILAKKVILATNAYTSHLLPSFSDLIVPCRGQMSALIPFPSVSGDKRLTTSLGFIGDGLDDYLIQRPNESGGQLMFGGGRQAGPSIGVTDDSVVDERTSEYLQRRLVEALGLPEGGKLEAQQIWTGIMGFSRDDLPWVGELPDREKGVYLAAGYTGHGMPNTWLCGKYVALLARGASEALAKRETGLPDAYLISKERMATALAREDVEEKDWAEIERGRASGTA